MGGLFGKNKTTATEQTKLGAIRVQGSSQGLPVTIIFGKTRITGNLMWYGNFEAIPHTESQTSGGKGGGSVTNTSTTYTYRCALAIGLCEGPLEPDFIGTIWSGKDVTDSVKLDLFQFVGSYTQSPWIFLSTVHPAEALAYRGQAYVGAWPFELGDSASMPNLSFEVSGLLGGGADVTPSAVIETLLTAEKFGAGWDPAALDISRMEAYCKAGAANIVCSPAYTAQRPAREMIAELARLGNSAPVWSAGILRFEPYADEAVGTFTPELTVRYNLTMSDFIAGSGEDPVTVTRKRQADAKNAVQLEVLDRARQYNPSVVEAKDQGDIELHGERPLQPIEAHAICELSVARTVAQTILQRELYVRNQYEFTVGWRFVRLEPMDVVTLTEPHLALDELPVRILQIEENENGELSITAEDLTLGVSTPGLYSPAASGGATINTDAAPGNTAVPVIFQPPVALTNGSPQIWIGSAGGANWGGAEIWFSSDGGVSYSQGGKLVGPANFGDLTANFSLSVDPDVTGTLAVSLDASNGTLTNSSNAAADTLLTLSYVGAAATPGELIAFSTANLTATHNYSLSDYIRRGQKGSTPAAHVAGENFMRLDAAVAHISIPANLFGETIYFKLLSYNNNGRATQSLSDVSPYSYTVLAQALGDGSGYPYVADKSSTAAADPGNGRVRWDNASEANAAQLYFNDITSAGSNLATFFDNIGDIGFVRLASASDSSKWVNYQIDAANAGGGFHTFNVTHQANGTAPFPNDEPISVVFTPTVQTLGRKRISLQPTDYTLTIADAGDNTLIEMGSPIASNVTIPSHANVPFVLGTSIEVMRSNLSGNVSILAEAGVTLDNSRTNNLRVNYSVVRMTQWIIDEWLLDGDFVP